MATENFGAKLDIDISNLKAGLAQANRLIKESKSEFKAAAAGLDDWRNSEEGLVAKQKELTKTLDVQQTVLEAYEKQMEEAGYASDDMSKEAVTLRTKINDQKAAIGKTEKELRNMDSALEELRSSSDSASDAVEDIGDAAEKADGGFTIAKGAIASFIGNGLTALASAAQDAIRSLLELAEATQEYREDIGKLETAWEAAGKSTELATKTYKDFYAVLGEEDRSVEAVNHLAKFVETEKDMATWTDICTGVWGTFGDSLPIEGLTEAANETAKTGELTGVLADALNWAGVNEDEFKASLAECTTEQERTRLITETLNGLYGDAAAHYKENNKGIMDARKATSDYADAQAELAETIEPLTTKLTQLKTQGFQFLIDDALPFLKKNLPSITSLFGGITAAIIAQTAATKLKVAIDKAHAAGLTITTVAQKGLNAAMKANPIGIIITAVSLLVSAFLYLWNNCEGFRKFFIKMWANIKAIVIGVWNAIKTTFSAVGEFFTTQFQTAYDAITTLFNKLPKFFSSIWGKIKNTFSSLGTKIGKAISGAVKGAINGVLRLVESRVNSAISLINGAIRVINKLPGVNVGRVGKVKLPRLAKGGVVNQATTALIGEDGAEAVVPLERNTEWIDKVADKLASKNGGAGVVVNQTNNYSQAHSRFELYKSRQQTVAAVKLAIGRA